MGVNRLGAVGNEACPASCPRGSQPSVRPVAAGQRVSFTERPAGDDVPRRGMSRRQAAPALPPGAEA